MTTDCSLTYKFNTWKFLAQTWKEHVWQKEELLTKIYLYDSQNKEEEFVAFLENMNFIKKKDTTYR